MQLGHVWKSSGCLGPTTNHELRHNPHAKGLLGHSDADVLIHVIIDALLGALGADDIGRIFSDTDATYKREEGIAAQAVTLINRYWLMAQFIQKSNCLGYHI